ncbi:pyrethroid hydrolase Ces2e-like isoform X2 [Haliotis asinina]|uniref:pyrethroid hydrolase Ces2e-like isoform X2 n=1 Tax=Haliotis asinina TaxID=109174 RepID=UPI003531EF43
MSDFSRILNFLVYATVLACVKCGRQSRQFVVRETKYGTVRGFVDHVHSNHKVEKYLGIPYASPPVGKLRFEFPIPPPYWGEINALEFPPACPQPKVGVSYIEYLVPGFNRTSEDCLYLNIYVPKHSHHQKNRKPYPTMVYIHGGSYQTGMGSMLDGAPLATHEVIVVTINYRLGPLGFLSAADSEIPGNFGMLDQIQALKWIKGNIAAFGGDPERITIDGHSAGGCSVGLLMFSPLARGLFQGVIQQSGSPFAHWALTRHRRGPDFYFKFFSAALGCAANSTKVIKKCLKSLPSEEIERMIYEKIEMPLSLVPPFRPVVDGYFLPDTPERLAVKGPVNAKYFLTGATQDEGVIAAIPFVEEHGTGKHGSQKLLAVMNCFRGDLPEVEGIVDSVMEHYTQWPFDRGEEYIRQRFAEIVGDYFIVAPIHKAASVLSRHNLTVFVYNYEYKSVFDKWQGVIHGAELFYLSGYPLVKHPNFRYDESDKTMARMLLMFWANFVKNGLPSLVPLKEFHMARFTEDQPLFTRFVSYDDGPTVIVDHHFKTEKLSFWNNGVQELYRQQYRNYHVDGENLVRPGDYIITHTSNSWILIAACIGLSVLTVLLSVCYCQMRRQVSILIRQNSVSSGERML